MSAADAARPAANGPAGDPPTGVFVVVERDGGLWGVPGAAVERLLGGGRMRLHPAGGKSATLVADRVVAVVDRLAVRPLPRSVARWWSEPAAGLAVYRERPLVVVDAARPPAAIREPPAADRIEDGPDGERNDREEGRDDREA